MFVIEWFREIKNRLIAHPGIAGSLLTFIFIILGMIHNLFFFIPLDIPIYNLTSTLSDFILPGARQLIILFVVVLIGVILALIFAWVVSSIMLIFRCSILSLAFLAHFLLLFLVFSLLLFVCAIFELVNWVIYKPSRYIYRSFEEGFTPLYSRTADTSKSFSFIGFYESLLVSLQGIQDRIERTTNNFLNKFDYKHIDDYLAKIRGYIPLFIISILIASGLTAAKAYEESCHVKKYENGSTLNFQNQCGERLVPLITIYKEWFLQVNEVKVRYRTGDGNLQNLLFIGSTSDFAMFWRARDSASKKEGRPVIISKSNIAQILSPHEKIDIGITEPEIKQPVAIEQPVGVILNKDDNQWIGAALKKHCITNEAIDRLHEKCQVK